MRCEDINGAILGTESRIHVTKITLELSDYDAYALCNLLCNEGLESNRMRLEDKQIEVLRRIGRDLGIFVDHGAKNNLGKLTLKVEEPK